MILIMIAEYSLAVGEQGGGDRLSFLGLELSALPEKIDELRGLGSQDGVFFDAVQTHKRLLGDKGTTYRLFVI
jgi:hypothetical protein